MQDPVAKRILRIAGLGLLALFITALAGGIWTTLVIVNLRTSPRLAWSVPLMALLLWLTWRYLGGWGAPRNTSGARRKYLRPNRRSFKTFVWSFIAGALSVIALAGLWIVFFSLFQMPPNTIPDVRGYPWFTLALLALMASLVAPFMEEAGFRGYFQVGLEREFGGLIAVIVSSTVFAAAHIVHGLVWPKLLVYFFVGVAFGSIAYFTNSSLPAIPAHIFGDLTFFTLVWPHDAARKLITEHGADKWFWMHVAQAVVFTVLALLAFMKLSKLSDQDIKAEHEDSGQKAAVA